MAVQTKQATVHVLSNTIWNYQRKPLGDEMSNTNSREMVWFLWELPKYGNRVYRGFFHTKSEMLDFMRGIR